MDPGRSHDEIKLIAADCKPDSCQDTLSTLKTGFNQIPQTQVIIGTIVKNKIEGETEEEGDR